MNSEINDDQESHRARGPSQLFLLRVWLDYERGENGCHGRIQHSVTGEARQFQSGAELLRLVREMMGPDKSDSFTHKWRP